MRGIKIATLRADNACMRAIKDRLWRLKFPVKAFGDWLASRRGRLTPPRHHRCCLRCPSRVRTSTSHRFAFGGPNDAPDYRHPRPLAIPCRQLVAVRGRYPQVAGLRSIKRERPMGLVAVIQWSIFHMQPDPISFLSLLDEHAAKHHHLSRNSRGEVVNAVRVTPGSACSTYLEGCVLHDDSAQRSNTPSAWWMSLQLSAWRDLWRASAGG